jgi:hypothetical protein
MKFGHSTRCASGLSFEAYHFLLYRFDSRYGFKPDMGESWIVQNMGGTAHPLRGQLGWYTGLWRSTTGKVYVSYAIGQVLVNPDPEPRAASWREDAVPGVLAGIWGLDDDCVFTWGVKGGANVLYRFDGRKWNELPAPGEILAMHGAARNLVYAVGRDGLVARWDGNHWTKVVTPGRGVLTDVHVVSEDEMYAVGSGGQLLQGSIHGWDEVLNGGGPLFGVAKWKKEVWVAAEERGVMKLAGSELVSMKANIKATSLDARGDLLVSSRDAVAGTADGTAWVGITAAAAGALIAGVPAPWRRR